MDNERKRFFESWEEARDFARLKEREGFGALLMVEPMSHLKPKRWLVEWRVLVSPRKDAKVKTKQV